MQKIRDWLKTNPHVEALYENFFPKKPDQLVSTNAKDPIDATLNFSCRSISSLKKPVKGIKCFYDIESDCYFDAVCQICAIGETSDVKFLLTWDATKSRYVLKCPVKTSAHFNLTNFKISKKKSFGWSRLCPGDWRYYHCAKWSLSPANIHLRWTWTASKPPQSKFNSSCQKTEAKQTHFKMCYKFRDMQINLVFVWLDDLFLGRWLYTINQFKIGKNNACRLCDQDAGRRPDIWPNDLQAGLGLCCLPIGRTECDRVGVGVNRVTWHKLDILRIEYI